MTLEQLIAYTVAFTIVATIAIVFAFKTHPRKRGHGISLLVPFRSDNGRRAETWQWLNEYWRHELPGAQIIIGTDDHPAFCKTAAINRAADKARGDIFVILDADCLVAGDVIEYCATEIRNARKRGNRLWFMPYRRFYRLTDTASREILSSDPANPPRFYAAGPPNYRLMDSKSIDQAHWFGALIQIMPREAFEMVNGMDTRFHGWGGEDVAFMHAVDTLYCQHKTSPNGVIHLWHPTIGATIKDRMWTGQTKPGANGNLAAQYFRAMGDAGKMRELVDNRKSVPTPPHTAISPELHS